MQHTFGYARISAADQSLDTQLDDLTRRVYAFLLK